MLAEKRKERMEGRRAFDWKGNQRTTSIEGINGSRSLLAKEGSAGKKEALSVEETFFRTPKKHKKKKEPRKKGTPERGGLREGLNRRTPSLEGKNRGKKEKGKVIKSAAVGRGGVQERENLEGKDDDCEM